MYRSEHYNVNRWNNNKRLVWYDIFVRLCIEHERRRCTRPMCRAIAVNVHGN